MFAMQSEDSHGTPMKLYMELFDTLRGRTGKVVAMYDAVACSIPAEVALIYTMHEALRGYCP